MVIQKHAELPLTKLGLQRRGTRQHLRADVLCLFSCLRPESPRCRQSRFVVLRVAKISIQPAKGWKGAISLHAPCRDHAGIAAPCRHVCLCVVLPCVYCCRSGLLICLAFQCFVSLRLSCLGIARRRFMFKECRPRDDRFQCFLDVSESIQKNCFNETDGMTRSSCGRLASKLCSCLA